MTEMAWERKKTKVGSNKTITLWLEHHQPVPSQCKGGGPTIKGVVWWRGTRGGGGGGGGNDLFSVSNQGLFWEVLY